MLIETKFDTQKSFITEGEKDKMEIHLKYRMGEKIGDAIVQNNKLLLECKDDNKNSIPIYNDIIIYTGSVYFYHPTEIQMIASKLKTALETYDYAEYREIIKYCLGVIDCQPSK